jgi:hypothetical protein
MDPTFEEYLESLGTVGIIRILKENYSDQEKNIEVTIHSKGMSHLSNVDQRYRDMLKDTEVNSSVIVENEEVKTAAENASRKAFKTP